MEVTNLRIGLDFFSSYIYWRLFTRGVFRLGFFHPCSLLEEFRNLIRQLQPTAAEGFVFVRNKKQYQWKHFIVNQKSGMWWDVGLALIRQTVYYSLADASFSRRSGRLLFTTNLHPFSSHSAEHECDLMKCLQLNIPSSMITTDAKRFRMFTWK